MAGRIYSYVVRTLEGEVEIVTSEASKGFIDIDAEIS
jgi:hypothetical protein